MANNGNNSNILKPILITCGVVCGIGILLAIFLLPFSFSYIEFNEFAFKKDTITNNVDESQTYTAGRYLWGPSFQPVTFPSIYKQFKYKGSDLAVFSDQGLEFNLDCDVYYRINQDDLAAIFSDFGTSYETRFRDALKASIKNTGPLFKVDDYIIQRKNITRTMLTNMNEDLAGLHLHIDPYKFLMLQINFPQIIKNKFLQTAIQELNNEKASLQQEVELIIKDTEQLVAEVNANITIIESTSSAQATVLIKNAEAESIKIQQQATGTGIRGMFDIMNITLQSERERFFELMTLIDSDSDVRIIVGDMNSILSI